MKSEILSIMSSTDVNWTDGMQFASPKEAVMTNQFEGGIILPYKENEKLQFALMKRYQGSELPTYRVRVQKVLQDGSDELDESLAFKQVVVLDCCDCESEKLLESLRLLYTYVYDLDPRKKRQWGIMNMDGTIEKVDGEY